MILFLDYGHGGRDRGCTAPGFEEAADTLDVGRLAKRAILATGWPVTIIESRADDLAVIPLSLRAEKARECNADLTISLHVDASPDPREYGPMAFRLASNSFVDTVCCAFLGSLARPGLAFDAQGREHVVPMASAGQLWLARESDWTKRAHVVLEMHREPSVLFEMGRASNSIECDWLKTFESKCLRAAAIQAATCAALIHRGEIAA